MKNDYDKCIKEVHEMKEKTYNDFRKSGFKNLSDFIKNELKGKHVMHRRKKIA